MKFAISDETKETHTVPTAKECNANVDEGHTVVDTMEQVKENGGMLCSNCAPAVTSK